MSESATKVEEYSDTTIWQCLKEHMEFVGGIHYRVHAGDYYAAVSECHSEVDLPTPQRDEVLICTRSLRTLKIEIDISTQTLREHKNRDEQIF